MIYTMYYFLLVNFIITKPIILIIHSSCYIVPITSWTGIFTEYVWVFMLVHIVFCFIAILQCNAFHILYSIHSNYCLKLKINIYTICHFLKENMQKHFSCTTPKFVKPKFAHFLESYATILEKVESTCIEYICIWFDLQNDKLFYIHATPCVQYVHYTLFLYTIQILFPSDKGLSCINYVYDDDVQWQVWIYEFTKVKKNKMCIFCIFISSND